MADRKGMPVGLVIKVKNGHLMVEVVIPGSSKKIMFICPDEAFDMEAKTFNNMFFEALEIVGLLCQDTDGRKVSSEEMNAVLDEAEKDMLINEMLCEAEAILKGKDDGGSMHDRPHPSE